MIDERSRRAHRVFTAALDHDRHERERVIAESCAGDERLRAEVDRLLRALDDSRTFLESPALDGIADDLSRPDAPPPMIGGYRIVRVLGAGGMATVYEAEQTSPRRRIALKVMHRALSRHSGLARFRFETEVLARLKHPGIAQIYEAGTTEDDGAACTPYYAMELVEGAVPLTAYASGCNLGLRQRLELFARVCDAVHHGHQLGVIHRDLKPGNILVSADGNPKVIDFGVARSADPSRTLITAQGDVGQLLGTLNFMSPEQCSGDPASIDIRTDVYSLGVVLYELLCGRTPHDVSAAPITEALRIVQHDDPRRPSALNPALRGDPEIILLKAIEKDRERRYATASELAADIRRYLADQPISARAPTTLYQVRKFARRHRPLVAGVIAVFITLIAGIAATTRMAIVATDARRAAERMATVATEARDDAERMAVVATEARNAAEARRAELERVAAFQDTQLGGIDVRVMGDRLRAALAEAAGEEADAFERLFRSTNFTTLAQRSLDENVLQRSWAAINEQFANQPMLRARLLQTLAATMNDLGLPNRAEPVLAEALALRRSELGDDHADTLVSVHSMGALLRALGRHDDALALLREAHEGRRRTLGEDHPDTLNTANSLGVLLRNRGDVAEAEVLWRATLESRRRVYGDDHPATLDSLSNLGLLYAEQGRLGEAEALWREVAEKRLRLFGEDDPETISVTSNLGTLLVDQGRLDEARPLLESALSARRRTLGDDHPRTLMTASALAHLLLNQGRLEEAEALERECLETAVRTLGPEHPSTLRYAISTASVLHRLERHEEAEAILRRTVEIQRRTLGPSHTNTLTGTRHLVEVLRAAGKAEEAVPLGAEMIKVSRETLPPDDWRIGERLAHHALTLGVLERWREAETALLEAHAILAAARGPDDRYTRFVARSLAALYASWNEAEPDVEREAKAEEWRGRAGMAEAGAAQGG